MITSSLKALVSLATAPDEDVLIPKCRTKIFQFSYFNRIAKLWNTLSESTRTLTSLNQFKSHVLQRYRLLFVKTITSLTLTPGSRSAANE